MVPEDEDLEDLPDEVNHDFTEEELNETWKTFRELRKNAKAGDMELMVLNRPVTKIGESNILIKLASALETSILDRFEDEAVQYLRKTLGNSILRIEREIQEADQTKKLYTSKDKYEYMVSQNPALKSLKERLGLDFDY